MKTANALLALITLILLFGVGLYAEQLHLKALSDAKVERDAEYQRQAKISTPEVAAILSSAKAQSEEREVKFDKERLDENQKYLNKQMKIEQMRGEYLEAQKADLSSEERAALAAKFEKDKAEIGN